MIIPVENKFGNVSLGPLYSPPAESVFALMRSSVPNNYKEILAAFIDAEVLSGNYPKIREMWLFSMNDWRNTTIGWKGIANGEFRARLAGFTSGRAIDFDGLTDHVNVGYRPASHGGGIVTLNNAGYGLFCVHSDNPGNVNNTPLGVQDRVQPNNIVAILELGTLDTIGWQVHENNLNQHPGDDTLNDDEIYIGRRTLPALTHIIRAATVLGGTGNPSTAICVDELYAGARNLSGQTSVHFDGELAGAFVIDPTGFNFTSFNTNFKAMIAGLRGLPSIPVINPYPDTHRLGIIFWGQSNMLGLAGAPPTAFQGAMAGVNVRLSNGTFATMQHNVNNGYMGAAGNVTGINLSVCKHLQKMYGRDIYVANVAVSGAGLWAGDPQPVGFNAAETKNFPDLKAAHLGVQSQIAGLGKTAIMLHVICQGEQDTVNETVAGLWKTNFDAILADIAANGGVTHYILLVTISSGQVLGTGKATVVAQQLAMIAERSSYAFQVSAEDVTLNVDNVHYIAAASHRIGERVFGIIRDEIIG